MTSKLKYLVASGIISAAMMSASSAFAAGTTQGTDIDNNVTVDFNVGGIPQTQETAADSFKVDRKVIFTVAEATPTGTTTVAPGVTGAVTTFTVTNTSNDVLDFSLAGTQLGGGAAEHGGTDNFNISSLQVFVDSNGNGTYDPGTDTATSIDDLAADASVTVFIIGDVAGTQVNGDVAGVTLTGTALNSDGTAITASTDADANTTGVETIFADTGRDGIEADGDDYTVGAASLTVSKVSRVISDGVSASNPKAIPGAVVEYCIVVSNGAGAATATGVTVSDDLDLIVDGGGTQIVTYDGTFTPKMNGTAVSGSTCTPGADNATYNAPSDTVSGTLNDIAAGETRTLVFRVTID
ncbi:MAG: hypothetical protein V3V15_02610 [Sphingorhabdus sp.]